MFQNRRARWRAFFTYALAVFTVAILLAATLSVLIQISALRWEASLAPISVLVSRLQLQVSIAVMLAAVLIVIIIGVLVERATETLRRLTGMIEQTLIGKFDGHVIAHGNGEVGQLVRAANLLVDKVRKVTKRRARERDRLNALLTHMSSGALILSEQGQVRLVNRAAEEILSTTAEKAIRKSFVQVVWDHRIAEVWQRSRQRNLEETEAIELGGERMLRVTVTPFGGNTANGFLVILQDITQVRRLEKMRRDFVSNVSHELRTPLSSLGALVDTLRDGALDDPPAAKRFLDRMEVEVDKMTQMVQELLELSRTESGQAPLRLHPASITSIVQPAADRLAMQAERAGVTLSIDIPPDLPKVMVDIERVQQVVINLLHNAIKFTPPGGRIVVSAKRADATSEMVVVSVLDSGVGIAKEDRERIFERFYKADRSRSGGGTGLGLAIAKHSVQAHNGRIWVESVEGKGSTFFFTLPFVNKSFTPE